MNPDGIDWKMLGKEALYRLAGIVVVGIFLFGGLALAQDAAPAVDAPISHGADNALSLYAYLAGAIAAVVSWLALHASALIRAHVKNVKVAGVMSRFSDSLFAAIKMVNQTLKAEILAAKDPKSPGGASITKDEAAKLRIAVQAALRKEYGGLDGLMKFLGVLGFETENSMMDWVDTRIEAAVHDLNKADISPK